jgi:MtrB/PioB family decaheme-associated outer membrane protein
MPALSRFRNPSLLLAAAALLVTSISLADAPAVTATPDTSGWKCTQCPFLQGYESETEVGVLGASGANASYGRYTGIDRSGAYADVGGSGALRSSGGQYANYDLERLGLASRDATLEGGSEGLYNVRISYDGQPTRLYDTAVTPFQGSGSNLSLPAGWVPSGGTGGMSTLNSSLAPDALAYDRRTLDLSGNYYANSAWTVFGELQRQEKIGTDLSSASFLTEAIQLPQPIDYVTDSLSAGTLWAGSRASLRLTYTGSWFEDQGAPLMFANPYLPIVPGSTEGRLGVPPSNTLQQLAAAGTVRLPWFASSLTYAASLGTLRQNDAFMPISTLAGTITPTPASLNGDVLLSHYALGLAVRPLSKLSLRGNATYDGRDDKTNPLMIAYIVTDTFPGGTATTPRYSEDRARLDGGADYELLPWMRIGVGGQLDDIHYGPGQVVSWTQDAESWGRATVTPIAPLSFTLKAGNGLRKASSFDLSALPLQENPQIYQYEYAPRDRVFSSLEGAWSVSPTLVWSLAGALSKNDYRSSSLGLQGTHEQRASSALTWIPRNSLSIYLDAGYERLFNLQNGYVGPGAAPWLASDTERYWNADVGGRWLANPRWTVTLDYLIAPTYEDTDSAVGGLSQAFPQSWTKLDSARLGLSYQWTAALQLHLRYERETYNSNDWALMGVTAATIPNLLALGIQPYRDNVNLIGLSVRYQLRPASASATASK